MKDVYILWLLGACGLLIASMAKCYRLQLRAQKANLNFNWRKDYLNLDALPILMSVVVLVAWQFLFSEAAASYEKISAFVRTSFFFMGLFGSYGIQAVLSRGTKRIDKVLDNVTDKWDAVTGTPKEDKPTLSEIKTDNKL